MMVTKSHRSGNDARGSGSQGRATVGTVLKVGEVGIVHGMVGEPWKDGEVEILRKEMRIRYQF